MNLLERIKFAVRMGGNAGADTIFLNIDRDDLDKLKEALVLLDRLRRHDCNCSSVITCDYCVAKDVLA